MAQEDSFTLDKAITAQKALRSELGLGEEKFQMDAFVGMISDEIEPNRTAAAEAESGHMAAYHAGVADQW